MTYIHISAIHEERIGREMKRINLRYIFKLFCLTAFAVAF